YCISITAGRILKVFNPEIWPLYEGFLEDLSETPVSKRGRKLAAEGHVLELKAAEDEGSVTAVVRGTGTQRYEVYLVPDIDDLLTGECSCSDLYDCRHAYAVALVLLGGAYRRRFEWALERVDLLPDSWRSGDWSGL